VQWAKTYNEADNNDSNNTHVVRLNGDQVLIGGRVHEEEFDGQMGDALLLRLDRASGAYVDSAFYFGGKGAEELTEHRLKGLGAAPDGTLYLVGQAYTANLNFTQYWGHWYAGRAELTDFIVGAVAGNGGLGYQMSDLPGLALAAPQGNQQFRDAAQVMGSQTGQPTLQAYIDVPMAEPLEDRTGIMSVGPLKANRDDCDGRQGADCFENGAADADVFVMKIGEAGAAPPPPPPPPAGCAEDADCAAGQVCNVRTGECEAAPPPPPPPGACPAGTLLLDAAVDGVSNGGMLQVTGSVPAAGLTQGTCGGAGAELVVRFTAAADGMYTFTTDGSPADTVLYLREACADAAAELGCNDDVGGGPLTSLVTVALTAGQTVFAYVDHFAPDVDPAVTLNIIAP
jgi:Cys-rich repeat protein